MANIGEKPHWSISRLMPNKEIMS